MRKCASAACKANVRILGPSGSGGGGFTHSLSLRFSFSFSLSFSFTEAGSHRQNAEPAGRRPQPGDASEMGALAPIERLVYIYIW